MATVLPRLDRFAARAAIQGLTAGQPPSPEIADLISVGMQQDLDTFESEYFGADGLLPNTEQGAFKLVEAYYGGGKTHYLRAVERVAHRNGFASAFVELHKDSCPLTRFDLIYSRVVEALTLPGTDDRPAVVGIADVIRAWIRQPQGHGEESAIEYAEARLQELGDLPFPTLRIALCEAARAIASDDRATLDETLVYLHSGKISPALRKRGILEVIDVRSGSLALRSLACWLRAIGYPGLVLILDEGDRSLSIASVKEKTTASNNLVQLINDTSKGTGWPGVLFLYSIPLWRDFQHTFGTNAALMQRVQGTGFPGVPPAMRIVLDDRYPTDNEKIAFCVEVGRRLASIFECGYPTGRSEAEPDNLARDVARAVVQQVIDVSFRRLFIQSYVAALFLARGGRQLSRSDIDQIVAGETSKLAD
jgi:hypothetical protein